MNSPHKGQWCGALVFSLICAWINGWVNNLEAGDLRRNHAHYDVTVMIQLCLWFVTGIFPRGFLCPKTFRRLPEPRRYGTINIGPVSARFYRIQWQGAIHFPSEAGNAVTPKDIGEIDLNQTTREHCTDNSTVYLFGSGQQQRNIKPPHYWPSETGVNRSTMVSPKKIDDNTESVSMPWRLMIFLCTADTCLHLLTIGDKSSF